MKMTLSIVGADIRNYRTQAGLSQQELADKSGVERSQLSKIEKGVVTGVTFTTIARLYESLGLTLVPTKKVVEKYYVHPFVKWAGGKTQLLEIITSHLPVSYNRYFEPFVGGGALLFKLQPDEFIINDANEELICVYKCFENEELFELLKQELDKHELSHSEEYFYKVREMDRDVDFKDLPVYVRAGRMLYLNKSCFNGLYRVNSKGFNNVPSGKKKTVICYDKNNFDELLKFFNDKKHKVLNDDFEKAVESAELGDFVYFDPPYDTWDDKDSFTSYDKNSFGKDEQRRLAEVFKRLSDKGVHVMLSNHNTKYINELYQGFNITVVPAKRMINSKADGRGEVEEVIITNYE